MVVGNKGRSPNQLVIHQTNLVRKLMYEDLKTDHEIVKELNININTFYDYKRRIMEQDAEAWRLVHADSAMYRTVRFIQRLEECELLAVKIRDDPNEDSRVRMEAGKTACEAQANIVKLINQGPTFRLSIPMSTLVNNGNETTK